MAQLSEIDALELKRRIANGEKPLILDVREPWEIATASLAGTLNIPMGDIPARMAELDRERETIVMCHHGVRSGQVAMYLARSGFERVVNLAGGIDAMSEIDPAIPRY
ncbi:MAG TPA: rhodanese-like domain-containing protein [Candidatus Binataceae bacterium]|nr:rhodanese-like domain-containing protein [Candidatus Binataceae bacterium]